MCGIRLWGAAGCLLLAWLSVWSEPAVGSDWYTGEYDEAIKEAVEGIQASVGTYSTTTVLDFLDILRLQNYNADTGDSYSRNSWQTLQQIYGALYDGQSQEGFLLGIRTYTGAIVNRLDWEYNGPVRATAEWAANIWTAMHDAQNVSWGEKTYLALRGGAEGETVVGKLADVVASVDAVKASLTGTSKSAAELLESLDTRLTPTTPPVTQGYPEFAPLSMAPGATYVTAVQEAINGATSGAASAAESLRGKMLSPVLGFLPEVAETSAPAGMVATILRQQAGEGNEYAADLGGDIAVAPPWDMLAGVMTATKALLAVLAVVGVCSFLFVRVFGQGGGA